MALHGKEKIWFLISTLEKEREITPKGEPVGLRLADDLNLHYNLQDLVQLSEKLEKEENAIKLVSLPTDQTYNKLLFKILAGFDKYIAKLEEDPEYLEWSGKKPKPKGRAYFGNQIDFNKSKEENKDKYISVGQIEEFQKMSKAEQERLKKVNLTEKHIKDIDEYKGLSLKLVEDAGNKIQSAFSGIKPLFADRNFVLPPNYQAETVGLLRRLVKQQEGNENTKSNKSHQIVYTSSRQVVLNGVYQLSQPRFNSENDLVFGLLYQNPNKKFSKQQLESSINTKITKPFHKIIENLGFKGDLASIFFAVSKGSICFRNPVDQNQLEQMGISLIKFNKSNNS